MFIFARLVAYHSSARHTRNSLEIADKITLRILEKGNTCRLFSMYGAHCHLQLLTQFFGSKIMFKLLGWLCYTKSSSYYYLVK